jgi:hypothetical protein
MKQSETLAALDPASYRDLVRRALDEDVGGGDVTTQATVPPAAQGTGTFLAKARCVVAGLDIAFEAFRQLDPAINTCVRVPDGTTCASGEVIAEVRGPAAALLVGERTALNFLQRLSGIATRTRQYVDASGGRIVILDTRKTTPTLRTPEKYAWPARCQPSNRALRCDSDQGQPHQARGWRRARDRGGSRPRPRSPHRGRGGKRRAGRGCRPGGRGHHHARQHGDGDDP